MVRRARDDRTWRIGTDAEVAWISSGTSVGRTITAGIPPVFEAYARVVFPDSAETWDRHDRAMLALLREQSPDQPWWLGYLDTGADDIVFPDALKVSLYTGWHYVRAGAGRRVAPERPGVVLDGPPAQLDLPCRPLLARLHAVGRRLDVHRRTGRAREQIRVPPCSAGEEGSPRRGRYTARSSSAVTEASRVIPQHWASGECSHPPRISTGEEQLPSAGLFAEGDYVRQHRPHRRLTNTRALEDPGNVAVAGGKETDK